jgi:hypothetical protein
MTAIARTSSNMPWPKGHSCLPQSSLCILDDNREGLHGLQIEQQAAQIRVKLQELAAGFGAFISNWDTLGKHLRNAQGQYDEGHKQLTRFSSQLDQIERQSPG